MTAAEHDLANRPDLQDPMNRRCRRAIRRHRGGGSARLRWYAAQQQRRLLDHEERLATDAGYDRLASGWI